MTMNLAAELYVGLAAIAEGVRILVTKTHAFGDSG